MAFEERVGAPGVFGQWRIGDVLKWVPHHYVLRVHRPGVEGGFGTMGKKQKMSSLIFAAHHVNLDQRG